MEADRWDKSPIVTERPDVQSTARDAIEDRGHGSGQGYAPSHVAVGSSPTPLTNIPRVQSRRSSAAVWIAVCSARRDLGHDTSCH
jgi:hypothetical protein